MTNFVKLTNSTTNLPVYINPEAIYSIDIPATGTLIKINGTLTINEDWPTLQTILAPLGIGFY